MTDTLLPPFAVTPAAVAQIETLGGVVRIDVEPGGCCGTAYAFSVPRENELLNDGDSRYGCPGAWLLVGECVAGVLRGAVLDYGGQLKPPRFRVLRNPNTPNTCSCRRSFGVPWPGAGQPGCCSYKPMPWDDEFEPPAAWKRQTGYRPERGSDPN